MSNGEGINRIPYGTSKGKIDRMKSYSEFDTVPARVDARRETHRERVTLKVVARRCA